MKHEPQSGRDTAKLLDLIEGIPVAMMTNLDAYGALTSRPMMPLKMDADGALWFYIDQRSTKVEHLQILNLAFIAPEHGVYVSVSGRGAIEHDRTHVAAFWTELARHWFPDGPGSAHIALLKVLPDAAEFWDVPEGRMQRMFAFAANVVAGRPFANGQHETIVDLSGDRASTRSVRSRRARSGTGHRIEPTT